MNERPTTLRVCIHRRCQSDKGSCAEKGSEALAEILERGIAERHIDITVERIRCLGQCSHGPSMRLAPGGKFFFKMTEEDLAGLLDELEQLCGYRKEKKYPAKQQFWPGS